MPLVNFANLDFDQIKTSIKDYLRSNSNFTDYDFEGSNLSVIIDVLAYNTYITSYNANMISNEVFIDSATLRENVVSLARNIGYVPKSRTSSRANISFFVDISEYTTKPETITLNKGIVCSTIAFGNENYTFSILDDKTVQVIDNIASFDNIDVYEGNYITTNFIINSFDPNQRFILPNSLIDSSSIQITVKPSQLSDISRKYRQTNNLFDINSESPIFFIQEIEDERYEIIFGDGVFGKKLEDSNYIEVSYLVSNGESSNGISLFNFSGKLTSSREGVSIVSGISLVTTNQSSFSGKNIESVESIKKYAPRIYSSQNRAVTSKDYESIIPIVYPETESISVFGGEELSPPQFGKVYVCVKPTNGAYLSNLIKDNIKREIKKYSVAGIVLEIIDLKYLYLEISINAYYNTNLAKSTNAISSIISNNVDRYSNSTELNKFGARFKYSKFLKIIDDSSDAVTSNITTVAMRRDLRAILNSFAEYEICFGNRFHIKNENGYNIKSSGFNVSGIVGTVFISDIPNLDKKTGSIFLFKLNSPTQPEIVKKSAGTIDYIKGEINLFPINITRTSINNELSLIEISASPYSNDVIGLQDLYLQLDMTKTVINIKPDNISSGYDTSGLNYIVSSSYVNGNLVRSGGNLNEISQNGVNTISASTSSSSFEGDLSPSQSPRQSPNLSSSSSSSSSYY